MLASRGHGIADFQPAQWTKTLEALELLDLLVRVDADVGWRVLLSFVRHSHAFAIYEAALFPRHKVFPRYVIEYIDSDLIRPYFQSVFLALRRMIGEDDQPWEPTTPDFVCVKTRLLDAWQRKHGGRVFDRTVDGRIVVKLQVHLSSDLDAQPVPFMLQHTLALATASRTLLPPDEKIAHVESDAAARHGAHADQLVVRRRRAVFCFVAVDVEVQEQSATNELLVMLLRIAREGLPIHELVLDQVVMSQLHGSFAGTFFIEVLSVWSQRGRGLKRFEFTSGLFDRDSVGAICSALAQSQTITEFAFTRSTYGGDPFPNRVPRTHWWPWLAYALFSHGTTHTIESVELDVAHLTMADVEAMRAVLQHPNPAAYVCALDESEPKSPVLTTAPTVALLKPRTSIAIGHRVVLAHEESVVNRGTVTVMTNCPHPIVRNNLEEGFLEIVLPGSGVGWIDRADVAETKTCHRRQVHRVKHLELFAIEARSFSAVLELLRLVGGSLVSLTLVKFGTPYDDAFLSTACTVCPAKWIQSSSMSCAVGIDGI